MRWTYDSDVHALYLYLTDAAPARQLEVAGGFVVDLDAEDRPVGVECLHLTPRSNFARLRELGVPEEGVELLMYLSISLFATPTATPAPGSTRRLSEEASTGDPGGMELEYELLPG